ncbi:uncharacterized protein LOC131229520 isoform X6 [Magnolia sinica]|nr:uncharacterized protein LOC131229520 isoform X6 [Magnolia sinica]
MGCFHRLGFLICQYFLQILEPCQSNLAYQPNMLKKKAWSSREKNISEAIHGVGRKGTAAVPRKPLYPSIGGRGAASGNIDQRAKGHLDGMESCGMATMSDETREALPKALLELFHVHKVCSSSRDLEPNVVCGKHTCRPSVVHD